MTRGPNQMIAWSEQRNANGPTSFGEMPGRNEAVATIIAWPTKHYYRTRRPALLNRARDGLASILHQFGGRRASGDGETVRFAHPPHIE
jgi:hypothetical protein